ncbi:hypothetical protein H2200_010615 [Cladophialophora chaetospira]|uniref:Uncharacterized protein n=1 Tax=Cladophialophora chaetospira TaxID=386627 RepID=A0AA39CEA5_9EURO|nr:hypothetical protein H2200_010615 [Cladophialophora chaetospira]
MSQIAVLGFTPTQLASPSQADNAIHWSILLSPNPAESPKAQQSASKTTPKAKFFFSSHSQRRLSKDETTRTSALETALFDMHAHQLRQQEYPVPITKSSSDPTSPLRTTTSILSDISNKPYTLSLRIHLATHPLPVPKLAEKVATLLYHTPTYGPGEDWLRAALDMLMRASILEQAASFDADQVLAFAGDATKEYLAQIERGTQSEHELLELDYATHIRRMESVRQMFSRDPVAPSQPAATRPRPQPSYFNIHHTSKPKTDVPLKTHKFLGFTISPGPSAYSHARHSGGEKRARAYFERQDDPYGGLM